MIFHPELLAELPSQVLKNTQCVVGHSVAFADKVPYRLMFVRPLCQQRRFAHPWRAYDYQHVSARTGRKAVDHLQFVLPAYKMRRPLADKVFKPIRLLPRACGFGKTSAELAEQMRGFEAAVMSPPVVQKGDAIFCLEVVIKEHLALTAENLVHDLLTGLVPFGDLFLAFGVKQQWVEVQKRTCLWIVDDHVPDRKRSRLQGDGCSVGIFCAHKWLHPELASPHLGFHREEGQVSQEGGPVQ